MGRNACPGGGAQPAPPEHPALFSLSLSLFFSLTCSACCLSPAARRRSFISRARWHRAAEMRAPPVDARRSRARPLPGAQPASAPATELSWASGTWPAASADAAPPHRTVT
jgi:hypothetical protein